MKKMLRIDSFQIVEDATMVVHGVPYDVKLTWFQRIFSWPWRPWLKFETIRPEWPVMGVNIDVSNMTITGHPSVIAEVVRDPGILNLPVELTVH